jgi:hypothetical protein
MMKNAQSINDWRKELKISGVAQPAEERQRSCGGGPATYFLKRRRQSKAEPAASQSMGSILDKRKRRIERAQHNFETVSKEMSLSRDLGCD